MAQSKIAPDIISNEDMEFEAPEIISNSEMTKEFEAFRPDIYLDTKGKHTVGYGFNIDDPTVSKEIDPDVVSGKRPMEREEADVVYEKLSNRGKEDAQAVIGTDDYNKLPDKVQGVVNDMAYNLGRTRFAKFDKTITAVKAEDYKTAADEMVKSKWYEQVGNRSKQHVETMRGIAPDIIENKDMEESPSILSEEEMNAPETIKSAPKEYMNKVLKSSLQAVAKSFMPGGLMPTDIPTDDIKRGARDTVLSSPQALGSLIQELGERSEELPNMREINLGFATPALPIIKAVKGLAFRKTDVDESITKLGKGIIEKNKEFIKENIPDFGPEGKNKVKDFLYNLGGGVTTLGAAVGITALTRSPHAASFLFGLYQKGQIYQQAREKGIEPRKAGELSTVAGVFEGALEYIGLEFLLSPTNSKPLFSALIKAGGEAVQEWSQQFSENLVVKMGGIDKTRGILQGTGTAALLGLVLGGGVGASIDLAQRADILPEIQNKTGLSADNASKFLETVIEKQTVRLKETISSEAGFARIDKGEGEIPIKPLKTPPEGKEIAKTPITEPLLTEAKKYKSAEEFAFNLEYHGTTKEGAKKIYKEGFKVGSGQAGISTTQDAKEALDYGEEVIPVLVRKDAKTVGVEGKDFLTGTGSFAASDVIALSKGTTKSQLTDIWNKAQETAKAPEIKPITPGKVKPLIHKVTGFRKTVDNIVTNEMALLKTQLSAEAKGAKIGEAVGKREIRTEEAIKRKVTGLTDSLKSMGTRKLPVEYKDQVDAILEQYDLKKRMEKTKAKRIATAEFVDTMREQGDLAFVPKDYFKDYGVKTTLDEMTLEDLEHLHNQVKVLVTVGSNQGKLIAGEKELDLENTVDDLSKTVYRRGKMAEPTLEEIRYRPPSARKKSQLRQKMDAVSKYFSGHRKVENLTKVLHIWEKVWMPIQRASNMELKKGGEMSAKFKQIFSPIAKQSHKMMTETIQVKGMQDPITRWEAIGVALNSENIGNVERLINGNQYTVEQIKAIKEELTPQERKFVEDTFELIDSYWADTEANTIKAIGVRPKKIEQGKYFPIKTDYSQDTDAQIRESQKDVMREVFSKAFLEKGFTKSRVGGRGPVDLNVLPVILKHLHDVIHYNAYVLPMRDVQKIINHPKFKKSVIDVMGEASYNELKPWLADTVNPKTLSPKNIFEVGASMLRRNSTAAILGWKVSVSLLQAGSFLQTVKVIGLKSALGGVADFYFDKGPIQATEWVYSKSEEMKNRSSLWDRELKDWMESKHAKQILEGLPADAKSTLFTMIRSVDFITVMPTWIGAYNKELAQSGDEWKAIDEADSTVRITQPMGSIKDLPRMMRGRPYQKFFTMFKSFYTTMHNQIVDIKDEYRFSDDPVIGKTGKAAAGMFWVWIAPSLLATFIRSGFKERDPKEYAKGLITFPLSGLFLISDLVSGIASGFEMGVPALKGFKELYYGIKGKKPYTKIKHLVKAAGTFAGKPVDALWTLGEGMGDLIAGKTTDPRRLVYSKYALKEKKEDTGKPGRKYIERKRKTRQRKYIKRRR